MPKYTLVYKKPATKDIQKLPIKIRKRLKLKLEWFISRFDPIKFDKALTKSSDA